MNHIGRQKQAILKDFKHHKLSKDAIADLLATYLTVECIEYEAEYLGEGRIDTIDYEDVLSDANSEETKQSTQPKLLTPAEIKAKLDEVVIGQHKTKVRLAIEVFKHYLKIQNETKLDKLNKIITKSNILLTGLTGTGKTFLMQQIAKILDVPIFIQDSSKLTCSGYAGEDVEGCLKGLVQNANGNITKAERGIIVLDEFDKLSRKSPTPSGQKDPGGESAQQGMLKMLEGSIVTLPEGQRRHPNELGDNKIDTTNILFVACGSFEGIEDIVKQRINTKENKRTIGFGADIQSKTKETPLKDIRSSINREDLKQYGMLPEVLGRFSILSNLHPLEKEDLINILKNQNSLFSEYKTIFKFMNKELIIKQEVYEFIADKALSERIGARGLKSIIEDLMCQVMYEMPSEDKKKYILDLDFCESQGMEKEAI